MSSGAQTRLISIVDDCGSENSPLEELHRFHRHMLNKSFAPLLVTRVLARGYRRRLEINRSGYEACCS
jgi:hypothetical protein